MKSRILGITIIAFLCFSLNMSAQKNTPKQDDKVEIVLKDGNRITGTIKSISEDEFVIVSASLGEVKIKKENISQVIYPNRQDIILDDNSFRLDYHGSTHYFVNPSGYSLPKGQSYYQNIGLFFNSVSFGITDNFMFSIGGEIASLLFASQFPIIYLSPRFSIPLGQEDKGSLSISTTFFSSPDDDFGGYGVAQLSLTLGSRNNQFTIGSGIGFDLDEGFLDEVIPTQISYMGRVSDKISFITDNFLIFYDDFDDSIGVISMGVRVHFKKNGASMDFSLWRTTEDQYDVVALPFVSATVPIK